MCFCYVSSPPSSLSPTPIVQDKFASIAMAILQCFGHKDLADKLLAADGVHHLGNLLSLSAEMHSEFGSLGLWFEPTKVVRYY